VGGAGGAGAAGARPPPPPADFDPLKCAARVEGIDPGSMRTIFRQCRLKLPRDAPGPWCALHGGLPPTRPACRICPSDDGGPVFHACRGECLGRYDQPGLLAAHHVLRIVTRDSVADRRKERALRQEAEAAEAAEAAEPAAVRGAGGAAPTPRRRGRRIGGLGPRAGWMATIRGRRPLDDLGGANLTLLLTLFDRKAWMIDLKRQVNEKRRQRQPLTVDEEAVTANWTLDRVEIWPLADKRLVVKRLGHHITVADVEPMYRHYLDLLGELDTEEDDGEMMEEGQA
jgi:hypothetical protein